MNHHGLLVAQEGRMSLENMRDTIVSHIVGPLPVSFNSDLGSHREHMYMP